MNRGKLSAIACVDCYNGLGLNGKLIINNKKDMNHFKEYTYGKVVVMGGETFRSLLCYPKGLSNRKTFVLTKTQNIPQDNLWFFFNERALKMAIEEELGNGKDVVICGGEAIYNMFIEDCDELVVTRSNREYKADKYFPLLSPEFVRDKIDVLDIVQHNDEIDKYEILTVNTYVKRNINRNTKAADFIDLAQHIIRTECNDEVIE